MVMSSVFLLTADRLFHVMLGLHYAVFWNVKKTWTLVTCAAIFNICVGLTVSFISDLEFIINVSISSLYSIYFVFTCSSYFIMFLKYLKSRRNVLQDHHREPGTTQTSAWNLFKNSNFFIPVVLSSTFLLLNVIPSLILTVHLTIHQGSVVQLTEFSTVSAVTLMVFARVSFTIDAIVYTLFQRHVRRLLLKLKVCLCSWCMDVP